MNPNEKAIYDKLISIVENLSEKELQIFVMMAQAVAMEKNILCGKE